MARDWRELFITGAPAAAPQDAPEEQQERRTYKLAGFPRASVTQLLGPKSVLSGVKHGARSGVMQGRIVGDAAQLGGAMVIGPGGEVLLEQRSQHAGDTISADDLLAAAA